MTLTFSTKDIPSRERTDYWTEVATKAFVGHAFTSLNGPSFLAEVSAVEVGDLGASTFSSDPCKVVRSARDVACDGADDLLLSLQVAGKGCFEQDGRQGISQPGDFVLMDARRPFTVVFPEPKTAIAFKVSRAGLEERLGDTSGMVARTVTTKDAVGNLVSGFLAMLPERVGLIEEPAKSRLAEQTLDLIALAFAAQVGIKGPPMAAQRATALFRLKSVIEASLRDHALKPAKIAEKAGISVRYANDLLSKEGFSVERYVLHRRLERCRYALEDPSQVHRKIGEIAYGWGFSDLSHFARRFRDVHGMTPSDYRQMMLAGGGTVVGTNGPSARTEPKAIVSDASPRAKSAPVLEYAGG